MNAVETYHPVDSTAAFSVLLEKRDFSGPIFAPGISWSVERLEWRAVGGPWRARLIARSADPAALLHLTHLLRCGLTVSDERGAAWWGCIHAVEVRQGARRALASLDGMGNRVAVRYRDFSPTESGGSPGLTSFYEDAASAALYGGKERIIAAGAASRNEASALALAKLRELKHPQKSARAGGWVDGVQAVVEARGWWQTLEWKTASETRGLLQNSTAGAEQPFGLSGTAKVGQTFTMPADLWPVSEVWVRLRKFAPTSDAVRLEICPNNSGQPGAAFGSVEVSGSSITDGADWVRFAFAAPLAVPAGVNWLVISRTGALSGTAYYATSVDQSAGLAGGQVYLHNGASWAARSPISDLNLAVVGMEETTEQARRLLGAGRCGQFFAHTRIEDESSINARMYRGGPAQSETGRKVIENLLALGCADGTRLLARVERGRVARIYRKPDAAAPGAVRAQIGPEAALRGLYGRRLAASEWPAGWWARGGTAAGEPALFIERCAWEPGRGVYLCEEEYP